MSKRKHKMEPLFIYEKPEIKEDMEPGGHDTISGFSLAKSRPVVLSNRLRDMGVECDYTGDVEDE